MFRSITPSWEGCCFYVCSSHYEKNIQNQIPVNPMMFTPFKWNFVARTFLKLFLSYDFKNRNIIAFCCCFLYFSFVGYLFFGHQCERFYNAGNLTIDSILSRVKKQYCRVIKFFKTSYQLHFLFSWNVFWTLIKEQKFVENSFIYTCSLKYCRAHLEHLVFTC